MSGEEREGARKGARSSPHPLALDRRGFLIAGLLAIGSGVAGFGADDGGSAPPLRAFDDEPPLRGIAELKNMHYGAAVTSKALAQDAGFAAAVARECAILVPEFEAKWAHLRPGPDEFAFDALDYIALFARTWNQRLRGHTLVWHESLPSWVIGTLDAGHGRAALERHIATVVGRYAGTIESWDVLNEGVAPEDGRPDALRNSPWLTGIGSDYVDVAFRAARAADPSVLLLYNDNGFIYATAQEGRKRRAILRFLERLRRDGVPIDGLGVEAHLAPELPFNARELSRFLEHVADLGLAIYVTELDICDRHLPADIGRRDMLVASAARRFLDVALEQPATGAVLTWGLSDRYSWLSEYASVRREDGLRSRGLPLDEALQRKPLWSTLSTAFSAADPRPPLLRG
jgi:endo-1,4-beta-xylanase